MKTFDLYESVAVVAPGSVLLFGLMQIYPGLRDLQKDGFTVGEFGVFVLLAFVGGHLLQALGDLLAKFWWKMLGGLPTDWVRTGKHTNFVHDQNTRLITKLKDLLQIEIPDNDIKKLTKEHWAGITRQMYAVVEKVGRARRVDVFNGNYGMFRGCIPAFLIVAALTVLHYKAKGVPMCLALIIASALAGVRMHKFAVHYASELFVQFANVTVAQLEAKSEAKKEEK